MAKATGDTTKSRPAQTGEPVMVRMQPDQLRALDTWRRQQSDLPNRPEAVRRLLQQALDGDRGEHEEKRRQ